MILVQGIGMSGYVPLEGVVGLSHFHCNLFSGKCVCKFKYLLGNESREASGFDVMLRVVSFAVVNRFDEWARSVILRDIGLLFGYHRAGVVFPIKLFDLFENRIRLLDYGNWTYIFPHNGYRSGYSGYDFGKLVYTTAWAEYISADFMKDSLEAAPLFLIQMLGRFEMPLPTFRCDELREVLMR